MALRLENAAHLNRRPTSRCAHHVLTSLPSSPPLPRLPESRTRTCGNSRLTTAIGSGTHAWLFAISGWRLVHSRSAACSQIFVSPLFIGTSVFFLCQIRVLLFYLLFYLLLYPHRCSARFPELIYHFVFTYIYLFYSSPLVFCSQFCVCASPPPSLYFLLISF